MSALVWDATGQHLYETGTDRGVLYQYDSATSAFTNGVAWNGLTAVTESPSGAEATALYADNIKYLNLYSAEEFGCTIEAYTYPEEFEQNDGSASLATGVTIGQQTRKLFGFCYRTLIGNDTEGNKKGYKLHLVYNCMASPSEKSYATVNDSPEAITFSWEVSTTPVNVTGGDPTATVIIDSTKVDATLLASFEEIIYGSASAEPRLPLPDEVASIFGTGSITLSDSTASVAEEGTVTLTATTVPAGQTVTWTSSDDTVATVANGVVTGVAAGSATITASMTYEGNTYTATCAVTVTSE